METFHDPFYEQFEPKNGWTTYKVYYTRIQLDFAEKNVFTFQSKFVNVVNLSIPATADNWIRTDFFRVNIPNMSISGWHTYISNIGFFSNVNQKYN